MNDFKFLNGFDLNEEQINTVTELLYDTGYYEKAALNNKLNLSVLEFNKKINIIPVLAYIRALIDHNNRVIAFHLCLTKNETIEFYRNSDDENHYYDDNKDLSEIISAVYKLYTVDSEDHDFIRHNSCIRKDMRGKGLLKILLWDQIEIAKSKSCNRIFSCTFESKVNSIKIFTHYGARKICILDFMHTVFKDKLVNLAVNISELELILKKK